MPICNSHTNEFYRSLRRSGPRAAVRAGPIAFRAHTVLHEPQKTQGSRTKNLI